MWTTSLAPHPNPYASSWEGFLSCLAALSVPAHLVPLCCPFQRALPISAPFSLFSHAPLPSPKLLFCLPCFAFTFFYTLIKKTRNKPGSQVPSPAKKKKRKKERNLYLCLRAHTKEMSGWCIEKRWSPATQGESSHQKPALRHSDLGFSLLRSVKNKFPLVKQPDYGILLWQPELTNTSVCDFETLWNSSSASGFGLM